MSKIYVKLSLTFVVVMETTAETLVLNFNKPRYYLICAKIFHKLKNGNILK